MTDHIDIGRLRSDLTHWCDEMSRAASVVEEAGGGSPYAMQVAEGNRAIAETMRKAAFVLSQLDVSRQALIAARDLIDRGGSSADVWNLIDAAIPREQP